MKIINSEKWSVTSSGSRDIIFNGNQVGDTVASELYVNPLANCTIAVKGYVSPDDTTGVTIGCIDCATFAQKASITTAGNYMFMVGSYYKVNVTVTGTADVILKWVF